MSVVIKRREAIARRLTWHRWFFHEVEFEVVGGDARKVEHKVINCL